MAQFFDISNWIHKEWSSPPKGSRPVKIFAHPETDGDYFFKQSAANYPSEFWSEVIASKIGRVAGLETLEYNVALHRGVLGCLSKSMVGPEPMMLIHGVDILSDHASGFEINHKPVHSFQQIMEVCAKEEFRNFKKRFLEMIVFDALIGNTDRHTENWGIILKLVFEFQEPKAPMKLRVKGGLRSAIKALIGMPMALEFDGTLPMTVRKEFIFSPVFDSGSCLGREINEASISSYLIDDNRINSYLNRSRQEIRWNGLRMNTFDMVANVAQAEPQLMDEVRNTFFNDLTEEKIDEVVDEIDAATVSNVAETFLSLQRKTFIKRLLTARLHRLKSTLSVS